MNGEKRKLPQRSLPQGLAGRITLWFMQKEHKSVYKNMVKALDLQPEDDLLEVACGSGHFLKKYASHAHSVVGLELSEVAVKLATKKNKERIAAGTAEIVQGEASQLPWEDNRFSVAIAMGSFSIFPKPVESLKEMYRVLRPGGRVVIGLEHNAEDGLDHTKYAEKYGMRVYTKDEVRAMMKEAAFSHISITYAKGFTMPKMMMTGAGK